MASAPGRLTNHQYMKLAEAISTHNMETIAQGYMDIDSENIAGIKQDNFYKSVPSNRDMLKRWADQPANSGPNQTKVSTHALVWSPIQTIHPSALKKKQTNKKPDTHANSQQSSNKNLTTHPVRQPYKIFNFPAQAGGGLVYCYL